VKRAAALQSLSRDHHHALVAAQALRRADASTAPQAREEFLAFWHSHGAHHFRCEEDILLPAYAGHGGARHPLVLDVLVDHMEIRHAADRLGRSEPRPEALHELGARLADHVRLEERQLFPLIEAALPENELDRVARALATAEAETAG
jgi:hemerythrin-like domain-containing protein